MFQPLSLQACARSRFPIGLISAASTNFTKARYSFIPEEPRLVLVRDKQGRAFLDGREQESFDECLDDLVNQSQSAPKDDLPPFTSGWLIYYGFENYLNWQELDSGAGRHSCGNLDMARLWRVDRTYIHDNEKDDWHHFVDRRRQDNCQQTLAQLASAKSSIESESAANKLVYIDEEDEGIFLDSCASIVESITRGDVIQVNLSRPWRLGFADPVAIDAVAQALARSNPSPYYCQFPLGEETIISASPERLFSIEADTIETRPLGGTVERYINDPERDAMMQAQLHNDAKLKSEHIMLVDLERNDISRICQPLSVRVERLAQVETHAHLHHLISVIRGRLLQDTSLSQVFRAMCPGGSISGCPKKMCLKILDRFERQPRQWYTGAFGYIDDSGSADINLLIRSLAIHDKEVYFRMGCGIVADSQPQAELAESRLKARGLLQAIDSICKSPVV